MNPKTRPCPKPDLLLALDEGVLPVGLASQVDEHLQTCGICARLRQDLRDPSMAEPTLAELERVRRRAVEAPAAPRRAWVKYAAAAVLVLLLLGGAYFRRSEKTPAPAVTTHTTAAPPVWRLAIEPAPLRLPLAMAMVLRGQPEASSGQYLTALGGALEPYRAGRYSEGAQALAALRRIYPARVEPPFYEGVARLLANDFAGSLEPLQSAHKIGGEALQDDIAWYLAIAHERAGDWPAAAPFLTGLCQVEGPHREASCAALKAQ